MTPLISGCLIVKNESANLARCLDSISPFVDELIVVDTGSTDDTVAIAERCGAVIHHFEWCDDFAAARNFALDRVQGQWVLMLDADEVLVEAQLNWTQQLPQDPQILALRVNLRSPSPDNTPLPAIRLFRNRDSLRYIGAYHESLTLNQQPLPAVNTRQSDLFELVHYGYEPDILPQKSRLRIPMLEKIRQREGLSYMLLWTLSGMYKCTHQPEHAERCYQEASERLFDHLITGEKPEDFRAVPSWLFGLGEMYLQTEDLASVQLICNRALEWCPDFPPIHYLTGLLLLELGFLRGALAYFEACVEFARTDSFLKSEPFDLDLLWVKPHFQTALIYRQLSEPGLAVQHFQACVNSRPDFMPAIAQLQELEAVSSTTTQGNL